MHKNLLVNKITSEIISKNIVPAADWKPFPVAGQWNQIPDSVKQIYIKDAEALLDKQWQSVPATTFLEYSQNGKHSVNPYLSAISDGLSTLIMAELFENKGRFLNPMVDAIWTACEMSLWGNASSPLFTSEYPFNLPDINNGKLHIVELRGGEIGAAISWAHYFFKDKFDAISPIINKRMKEEIDRRILTPCLERSDFFWMGYDGRRVNNWNPWVNSNWLICTLILENDIQRRNKSIEKIIESTNFFLNGYGDDGGCDEGPNYWSHAPGSLFDILQLLNSASNGKISLFNEDIIKNIGKYMSKMYIGKDRYVNFADAVSKVTPCPGLVYNYGKAVQDSVMMKYGSYLLKKNHGYLEAPINRVLWGLSSIAEIVKVKSEEPLIMDTWSPNVEVMTARQQAWSTKGFYFAAKGGHNGESHNHNDVGHFMLFYAGNPILVDAGVGVYSEAVFGPKRYELWTMQSAFHNLPTINGVMQHEGKEFTAKNVKYSSNAKMLNFSMDIAGAYPENASVKTWNRKMNFNKLSQVFTIEEQYELDKFIQPTELNYLAYIHPQIDEKNGIINFEIDNQTVISMSYNTNQLTPIVENRKIKDTKLKAAWGEKLYRLKLKINNSTLKDKIKVVFKKI
jgi:hypothetical protein